MKLAAKGKPAVRYIPLIVIWAAFFARLVAVWARRSW
jgi:hypothetical protein